MSSAMPRCLSRTEAAAYCGLTPAGLSLWIDRELVPGPMPGTRKWDRLAVDRAIDKLSGVESQMESVSAYDEWKARRGNRAA